VVRSG